MLSILAPPFNADEAWLRPKSVSPDGLRNNWNQQLLLAVERRPVPSERRDAQLDQHGTDVAVLVSIEAFERAGSMVCNCRLCSALFGVWPMSCIRSMCRWTFTTSSTSRRVHALPSTPASTSLIVLPQSCNQDKTNGDQADRPRCRHHLCLKFRILVVQQGKREWRDADRAGLS